LIEAIKQLRKGASATSQNAEDKYNALSKYARNLNDLAGSGKLDPVIGRDEEIRRVLQILSRRTKIIQFLLVNLVLVKLQLPKDLPIGL